MELFQLVMDNYGGMVIHTNLVPVTILFIIMLVWHKYTKGGRGRY